MYKMRNARIKVRLFPPPARSRRFFATPGTIVLMILASDLSFGESLSALPGPKQSTSAKKAALTLDRVLSSVEKHYPLVQAALEEEKRAQGQLRTARGGFDPTVKSQYQILPTGRYQSRYVDVELSQATPLWGSEFALKYRRGEGDFSAYNQDLVTGSDGELSVGAKVPILQGGAIDQRRSQIEKSKREVELRDAAARARLLTFQRDASYRYIEWLLSGERLKIMKHLLELSVSRNSALKTRVGRGDLARIEQTDNERSVVQRETAVIALTRAFEKAALELSLFYRSETGAPLVPSQDELPDKGLQAIGDIGKTPKTTKFDIQSHPEVQRIESQIQQNTVDNELASNALLPVLNAEVWATRTLALSATPDPQTDYKAALKFELPLFLRNARGRVESTSAEQMKLSAEVKLVRERIQMGIQDAEQACAAARVRFEKAGQEVELSQKVEDAERIRLRQGESNILILNLREQTTAEAETRVIESLSDYHRAIADLRALTATEISGTGSATR